MESILNGKYIPIEMPLALCVYSVTLHIIHKIMAVSGERAISAIALFYPRFTSNEQ